GAESLDIATTMDLLPACLALAGAAMPDHRTLDGRDIMPLLKAQPQAPLDEFYYFLRDRLEAIRKGDRKLRKAGDDTEIELYHLGRDPSERYNVAEREPGLVRELQERMAAFAQDLAP